MTMPRQLHELNIKIFADGADKLSMIEAAKSPFIKGFTTNPTLMKKAGITDVVLVVSPNGEGLR